MSWIATFINLVNMRGHDTASQVTNLCRRSANGEGADLLGSLL